MNHFDYNLLRVLEVLLEEQSVTAAASRLHLSQSAVSKQLAKLRETFDDPLFERTAHGLRATPRAMQLAPQLRQVLQQLCDSTTPARKLLAAPKQYCTDNAVMVASLAYYKFKAGLFADFTLEPKATG